MREASTRDEKLTLVYASALSAARRDGERVALEFQRLARDPDPGVRQSVIIATGYFPHPDLVALVGEMGEHDPVDHVRRNARILLDGPRG